MKKMFFIIVLTLLATTLAGCSSKPSRPKLYPNELYNSKGVENVKNDIDDCLAKAQAYLNTDEGKELKMGIQTRQSSFGTSVGVGFGSSRRSGFGFGVNTGFGRNYPRDNLSSEEKVIRIFTNECLLEKGYQVLGWGS